MAYLEGSRFGNYELLELIGAGGMAEVYRARQLNAFGREVAIKVIKDSVAEQPLFHERFLREAQTTARLSHPHILPLIESGTMGRTRKHLFLAMPYVPDGTLRDLLARTGGPLPIETITSIFIQLCDAVQYAHEQGLIHRDIKPSNILLQHERYVQLADFGIAFDTEDIRLTSTGVGLGTPEYTAPEQAQGMADKRSDIYSLGIVLFELLTGQVPFSGRTPYEVFYKQTTTPIPSLRSINPALPETLARLDPVIQRALAKEPDERFQTASALSKAFQAALAPAAAADDLPAPDAMPLPAADPPLARGSARIGLKANLGVVTPVEDDPLGERPTNPASRSVQFRGFTSRQIEAEQPATGLSKVLLAGMVLLALLLLGGVGFILTTSLLNGLSGNPLSAPQVLPTSSPNTPHTAAPSPTSAPRSTPTTTPTATPVPSPSPSPSPSPNPSPTPTPTLPLPTLTPP
jgi:serine/threonine protein kinase